MNKTSILGIIALVVVVGGAFLLSSKSEAPAAAGPAAAGATATAAAAPAPDFALTTLNGKPLSLADYKGKKAVVLDFFATWCPNCRRDIPHLETFYQKYKDRVEVVGVDLQEEPSVVKAFVDQIGATYPIALDPRGVATQAYAVRYTNYHVLIDKSGNVVTTIPGDIGESDIAKLAAL